MRSGVQRHRPDDLHRSSPVCDGVPVLAETHHVEVHRAVARLGRVEARGRHAEITTELHDALLRLDVEHALEEHQPVLRREKQERQTMGKRCLKGGWRLLRPPTN
eukprot:812490-Pleurochrysis_carterae.AAC.1